MADADSAKAADLGGAFPWLQGIADAACVVDLSGRILAANALAHGLFEYTPRELLQRNLASLYPDEVAQDVLDGEFVELLKSGEITKQEIILQKKSGSHFPARISIAGFPVAPDDTRYLVQIENLSSQKIVEASRIMKQKVAEQESRRKMDFLSIMSHEIRTPLHGISGALTILDKHVGGDGRRAFNLVQSSVQSLFRILDDVLLNAALELDQLKVVNAPFSIYQMGEELLSLYRHIADIGQNELEFFVAADVPLQLVGDGGRIRQIMANYLMNALKFTKQGTVRIDVGYDTVNGLLVAVSDDGQGIDVKAKATLFDMFGQGESLTRSNYAGTGLGLAICKRLAERMDGQVGFRSEAGHGACFWFSLPLAVAEGPPSQPLTAGYRVLLWDVAGSRWAAQLAGWGAQVLHCEPGAAELPIDPVALALVVVRHEHDNARQLLSLLEPAGTPAVVVGDLAWQGRPPHQVQVISSALALREIRDALARLSGQPAVFADASAVKDKAKPLAGRRHHHILLVEDSLPNAEIYSALLQDEGYRVDHAADGLQAVEAFKRSAPDLILMDIQMPVCDGYEASRWIRKIEAEQHLPPVRIIALTADVSTVRSRDSDGQLFERVLCKPIMLDALVAEIESETETNVSGRSSDAVESRSEEPVALLDTGFLQRQFGRLAPRVVLGMTDIFQKEATDRLEHCRAAVSRADLGAIRQQAHALKSSAAGLGLLRLAALARTLEQLAMDGDSAQVAVTLAQATAAFQPDLAELRHHIQTVMASGR